MNLLDTIQHAIALGFKVSFSREVTQCKIELEKEGNAVTQMLPLDNHMNYALCDCIKFCMDKVAAMENQMTNGASQRPKH